MLIEPKEIEIDGANYRISKFPAIIGRQIVSMYPLSSLPKIGDYKSNEEAMLKLMKFVAAEKSNGEFIQLCTEALVNSHVKSWETLAKLEIAMLEYNCSFFQNGLVSNFLESLAQKVPAFVTKILTDSLQQLSQTEKQP